MTQKIPFLTLFSALNAQPEVAGLVSGWCVTGAEIDKRSRAIQARVLCPVFPAEELRRKVETALVRT